MDEKLSEWLDKQGYPLEMRVAKLFMEKGFFVRQSPYYLDKETDVRRELDLVASRDFTFNERTIRYTFAIECKNNREKPWVAFVSKNHALHDRAFIAQKCATRMGRKFLDCLAKKDYSFNEGLLFKQPEKPAYNLTQAFENKSDSTYSAIYSVAKGSQGLIASYIDYVNYCEIVFPIVVIGGRLFESYIDEENEFKTVEVDRTTLIWGNPIVGMPHTTILIETFRHLNQSIEIYKREIKELNNISADLLEEALY